MGFTGALVAGVWIGHDDFSPMSWNGSGVTDGSLPAMTSHAFMSVAHTNMNIPQIPGLPLHPKQVAELARLADLKRTNPRVPSAQIPPTTQRKNYIMPDQTRELLKRLRESMRRAAGLESTPAAASKAFPHQKPMPGRILALGLASAHARSVRQLNRAASRFGSVSSMKTIVSSPPPASRLAAHENYRSVQTLPTSATPYCLLRVKAISVAATGLVLVASNADAAIGGEHICTDALARG
jgi:membrane peptidoglycan carboxypeptidase